MSYLVPHEICALPLCIKCWPWLSGKTWKVSEESKHEGSLNLMGRCSFDPTIYVGCSLDTQRRTNALFIPHSNLHNGLLGCMGTVSPKYYQIIESSQCYLVTAYHGHILAQYYQIIEIFRIEFYLVTVHHRYNFG